MNDEVFRKSYPPNIKSKLIKLSNCERDTEFLRKFS